jgi:hypothetical protein
MMFGKVRLRSSWNAVGGLNYISGSGHKVVQTCAGDDDRVPPAMRLFCETTALVFSEFYEEMLTLNLQLSRNNNIVHDSWRGDPVYLSLPIPARSKEEFYLVAYFSQPVNS